jgi:hypothetical protein
MVIELGKLLEYKNFSQREGCCELKKGKPRFDEGCSELLGQRKQVRLQRLQDPSEIKGDNLDNVIHKTMVEVAAVIIEAYHCSEFP